MGNSPDRLFGSGFGHVEKSYRPDGAEATVRWMDEGADAWLRNYQGGGHLLVEGDCEMGVLDTRPRVSLLLRGELVQSQRVEQGHFRFEIDVPNSSESTAWLPLQLRISSIGQHEYAIPRLRAWRVSSLDWTRR